MYQIGNMQQKLKTRITQHYKELKDLVNKGLTSSSFTKHAANYVPTKSETVANDIHTGFNVEIL